MVSLWFHYGLSNVVYYGFTMVSLWFHYGLLENLPVSSIEFHDQILVEWPEDGDLGDRDQRWGDALETIRRGMGKG